MAFTVIYGAALIKWWAHRASFCAGVIGISLVSGFAGGFASAESVFDVAKVAVPNHPSMVAQRELLRAAEIGIREARAGFLPTVDLRLAPSRARTNSSSTRGRATRPGGGGSMSKSLTRKEGSLTVNQMLFDGFTTSSLVGAASARFKLGTRQFMDVGEAVSLRVAAGYVGVARDRALLDLADNNIRRHMAVIEQIQIQVDAGGTTVADLDQARARLEGAKANYLQVVGRVRNSEAAYIEAVGLVPENLELPTPDPAAFVDDLDAIFEQASQKSHSLASARLNIESATANRRAARAPFLPRVDLTLLGSRTEDVGGALGMSSDAVATINFTYNFFRGGGDAARLTASKIATAEARARLLEAERLVAQNVRVSFNTWQTALAQIPALVSRAESAKAALDSYYEQFKLGKRTLLEVLNAETEVFGARSALTEGRASVVLGQYQVLASMGGLAKYLGVVINEDLIPSSTAIAARRLLATPELAKKEKTKKVTPKEVTSKVVKPQVVEKRKKEKTKKVAPTQLAAVQKKPVIMPKEVVGKSMLPHNLLKRSSRWASKEAYTPRKIVGGLTTTKGGVQDKVREADAINERVRRKRIDLVARLVAVIDERKQASTTKPRLVATLGDSGENIITVGSAQDAIGNAIALWLADPSRLQQSIFKTLPVFLPVVSPTNNVSG